MSPRSEDLDLTYNDAIIHTAMTQDWTLSIASACYASPAHEY